VGQARLLADAAIVGSAASAKHGAEQKNRAASVGAGGEPALVPQGVLRSVKRAEGKPGASFACSVDGSEAGVVGGSLPWACGQLVKLLPVPRGRV